MSNSFERHPKGTDARILLSGVFGPYARDDEYGSRKIFPMELYQNQITRFQGPFSVRMFHQTFQLYLLMENIDAPCAVLDFPSLERFVEELKKRPYDIIGISGVPSNLYKVIKMCELIREFQPSVAIVVGGHVTNIDAIGDLVDADHVVKGEGISWLRRYLGMDENAPIKHPAIPSGFDVRVLGFKILNGPGDVGAILIPSVGCPLGCEFCGTSAMFGGKGRFENFFETGDELFEVMCGLESKMRVKDFFIQDENFLLQKKRALRLLELMEEHNKCWTLFVFASADALNAYSVDQLVRLGIGWVWLGIEAENSHYKKLKGINTKKLVKELQANGVMLVGSSIIGLEYHKPEDMDGLIDWAVEHETDFHQFMLYHAVAGTPLYKKLDDKDRLEFRGNQPWADFHGMVRFNYRHTNFKEGEETVYLYKAFEQDLQLNGPSIARTIRTTLMGWQRHKNHPDLRVRRRYKWNARYLSTLRSAGIWAMRKWFEKVDPNESVWGKMDQLLKDLYGEFGLVPRIIAPLFGPVVYWGIKREAAKLDRGVSNEPRTFFQQNRFF